MDNEFDYDMVYEMTGLRPVSYEFTGMKSRRQSGCIIVLLLSGAVKVSDFYIKEPVNDGNA